MVGAIQSGVSAFAVTDEPRQWDAVMFPIL